MREGGFREATTMLHMIRTGYERDELNCRFCEQLFEAIERRWNFKKPYRNSWGGNAENPALPVPDIILGLKSRGHQHCTSLFE